MKKDFIEKQKEKLLQQRNDLLTAIAGRNADVAKMMEGSDPGDEVDTASDTIDGYLMNQLGEQDSRRLNMINNALERIAQGHYGICLNCGENIPEKRLEALPFAMLCMECQEKLERENR